MGAGASRVLPGHPHLVPEAEDTDAAMALLVGSATHGFGEEERRFSPWQF